MLKKIILLLTFFVYAANEAYSISLDSLIQTRNVYILILAKKWGPGKVKIRHFIYFDNNLYSGDYWDGYNLGCLSYEDTVIDRELEKMHLSGKIFHLSDTLNHHVLRSFHTSNNFLNELYYWTCISVNLSFIKLHCDVGSRLINDELYKHPNGVRPFDFEAQSIKICDSLPKKLLDELIAKQNY